ncbi:MAG: 2-polyprenylphenol 6-hydroxylase, partial [Rhizobiales bacterium]|nr:2-polyprenylphenol 6-hydroxylase [Hyphomicrobiales bacterium]
MANAVTNACRLMRAGFTLARHGALLPPEQTAQLPWAARKGLSIAQWGSGEGAGQANRISTALSALGPSYIKLGQFLATRPDMIGAKRAFELKVLQDKLPPFSMEQARATILAELGHPVGHFFASFSEPVAAASVAQVHKAVTHDGRTVAVKILRPGVEKRFAADIESFGFAARLMESLSAEGKRLRPVAAVAMLEQSMKLELDLRMEASAIAEMRENTRDDPGFRLPTVDWATTSRRVLTTEWIDGTPMADVEALRAQGLDLVALGDTVIQSFLRHAIRDGFFHADMHQGNLMVDGNGQLVALDFGIMGRLAPKERLFLAEILHGFITRDYKRVAQVHFDAGYVPLHQDVNNFAQALRAIGEPILGLPADQISMARLLTQLFEVTEQFDMQTQPQLLLLQKTMVVVEGVARTLNPNLNMWKTAEPVVRGWIERTLGPIGKLEEAGESLRDLARLALQ